MYARKVCWSQCTAVTSPGPIRRNFKNTTVDALPQTAFKYMPFWRFYTERKVFYHCRTRALLQEETIYRNIENDRTTCSPLNNTYRGPSSSLNANLSCQDTALTARTP